MAVAGPPSASELDGSTFQSLYVLAVNALDKYDNDKDIQTILQLLADARSQETARIRIFLTSRPEFQSDMASTISHIRNSKTLSSMVYREFGLQSGYVFIQFCSSGVNARDFLPGIALRS